MLANSISTSFDQTPKIGPAQVDLLRLYKRVTSEGGYDRVSDTRNNKLAWRRIAQEFLPLNANMVQFAFQVKTAYYKNLAYVDVDVATVARLISAVRTRSARSTTETLPRRRSSRT
jgi:chromatin structure-remodeling complex subunit RSC9